jgi:hypothetical protein
MVECRRVVSEVVLTPGSLNRLTTSVCLPFLPLVFLPVGRGLFVSQNKIKKSWQGNEGKGRERERCWMHWVLLLSKAGGVHTRLCLLFYIIFCRVPYHCVIKGEGKREGERGRGEVEVDGVRERKSRTKKIKSKIAIIRKKKSKLPIRETESKRSLCYY